MWAWHVLAVTKTRPMSTGAGYLQVFHGCYAKTRNIVCIYVLLNYIYKVQTCPLSLEGERCNTKPLCASSDENVGVDKLHHSKIKMEGSVSHFKWRAVVGEQAWALASVTRIWVGWGGFVVGCEETVPNTMSHQWRGVFVLGVHQTVSKGAEHENHQRWCLLVFGVDVCQWVWKSNKHEDSPIAGGFRGRKDTDDGVSSCPVWMCVSGCGKVTNMKTHLSQVVFMVDMQFLWYNTLC